MDKAAGTVESCAIYCRLSREDAGKQQESESIQNQKSLLLEYAARQGWAVFRLYCDEDYSGVDRERPAWKALLQDARDGRFTIVLCKTQSRFTRDMELVERYIHGLFPVWGIRFVAVLDNIDTAVQGNKKARQINGLVNEWYLEDLSENIRAVLDQKRREGRYIGSFPVYGYRKDPADHNRLLADAASAEVVRYIFRLYLDGLGTQRIAARLNEESIPNPTSYKRAAGLAYSNGSGDGGGLWNHTTVSRILRNEMYTGTMVQGIKCRPSYKSKKLMSLPRGDWVRVEGTHQPLVNRDMFDAVQSMLKNRTRSAGTGQVHLLAGKVFCLDCGAPLIKASHTYKGNRRSYLRCKRYAAAPARGGCTSHSVRLDRLESEFSRLFTAHLLESFPPEKLTRLLTKFQHSRTTDGNTDTERDDDAAQKDTPKHAPLSRELAKVRRELARLSAALRSLYLDRVDGILPVEQFTEMSRSFLTEQAVLQNTAARLEAALTGPLPKADTPIGTPISALLTEAPFNRMLVSLLVDRVEVGERRKNGEGRPGLSPGEIHIRWKDFT